MVSFLPEIGSKKKKKKKSLSLQCITKSQKSWKKTRKKHQNDFFGSTYIIISKGESGTGHGPRLTPVAETGFSHRMTVYKFVGHFFELSYRKISGHNQVKNIFSESVTFHFSNLGVGITLSHRHVGFFR